MWLNFSSQVALRMRQRGYKEGFNAKDTVPYIICYEQVPKTEDQLNIIRYPLVFSTKYFMPPLCRVMLALDRKSVV